MGQLFSEFICFDFFLVFLFRLAAGSDSCLKDYLAESIKALKAENEHLKSQLTAAAQSTSQLDQVCISYAKHTFNERGGGERERGKEKEREREREKIKRIVNLFFFTEWRASVSRH
jgi:hypothetical protein